MGTERGRRDRERGLRDALHPISLSPRDGSTALQSAATAAAGDIAICGVQSNPLNASPDNGSIRSMVQVLASPIL